MDAAGIEDPVAESGKHGSVHRGTRKVCGSVANFVHVRQGGIHGLVVSLHGRECGVVWRVCRSLEISGLSRCLPFHPIPRETPWAWHVSWSRLGGWEGRLPLSLGTRTILVGLWPEGLERRLVPRPLHVLLHCRLRRSRSLCHHGCVPISGGFSRAPRPNVWTFVIVCVGCDLSWDSVIIRPSEQ